MIARTRRSHTVFCNLGWVAIGIFVCEALCRAFKIAPGHCPVWALVIDALEPLAIVAAVLAGLFYPLKADRLSMGASAFAVLGGVVGDLAAIWSALPLTKRHG